MNLKSSIYIYDSKKSGLFCIAEFYDQFIFGKIERITNTKRTIVVTNDRVHTLPKTACIYIFVDEKAYENRSSLWIAHVFPKFKEQALEKCQEMGIIVDTQYCISRDMGFRRPFFSTYQQAKAAFQKLPKENKMQFMIHDGFKRIYPKQL